VIDASAKYHFLADFKAADLLWKPPAA